MLLVPVIFIKAHYGPFGFFDWERDGARYFRWTERQAQGWVQCLPGAANSEIFLRASRPTGRIQPAQVAITTIAQEPESILLRGDEMQMMTIRCPRQDAAGVYQVPYRLNVSNPWSPRLANIGGDPRVFGIQVVTRSPQSTLPF